jgi:hypothetical protein
MLDRDPSVNAYAVGGNFLAVNLGLIAWCQTREELAFTLAHELSHNILKHWETSAYETAKWLSSDEYKQSVNAVLDSKYERLKRSHGLSTRAYNFSESSGLEDSLKTHPDCLVRYEKTKDRATPKGLQGQNFWKTLPPPEKDLKPLFYAIALDPEDSDKNRKQAAKAFFSENGNSMYCEFALIFEK